MFGIQVEKRINIAAVARQLQYRLAVERLADGLVFRMDYRGLRRHRNRIAGCAHTQHSIHARHRGPGEFHTCDDLRRKPGGSDSDLETARPQPGDLITAGSVRGRFARTVGGQTLSPSQQRSESRAAGNRSRFPEWYRDQCPGPAQALRSQSPHKSGAQTNRTRPNQEMFIRKSSSQCP